MHDGAFLRAPSPLPLSPHSCALPPFLTARILYARLLKVAERKDGVAQAISVGATRLPEIGEDFMPTTAWVPYLFYPVLKSFQIERLFYISFPNIRTCLKWYKESNEKLCMEKERAGRMKKAT